MNSKPSSPACFLGEAPDGYLGYLPADELAGHLAGLAEAARQAGQPAIAGKLDALRQGLPTAQVVVLPDAGLAAGLDALLPKIRDDELHATLRVIRAALA